MVGYRLANVLGMNKNFEYDLAVGELFSCSICLVSSALIIWMTLDKKFLFS